MRLVYIDEVRVYKTPDGAHWTTGWGGYETLSRFLTVFDEVIVSCRVGQSTSAPDGGVRCDGRGVGFYGLPHYIGPREYFGALPTIRRRIKGLCDISGAVLIRTPSVTGFSLASHLAKRNRNYGVVVTANPHETFGPGANDHRLRPVFRAVYDRGMRRTVGKAKGVWYVTAKALQQRYPAAETANVIACSDVELADEWYAPGPRRYGLSDKVPRIVCVASFVQMYKGQDTLVDALSVARNMGVAMNCVFVGDGRQLPGIRARAEARGLGDAVQFVGNVAHGESIKAVLDESDLFVLPSRTEGLSRALIEAMARGLPCVATDVGGNHELLEGSELVNKEDPVALACKLKEMIGDKKRLERISERNLSKARQFNKKAAAERLRPFLLHLRETARAN